MGKLKGILRKLFRGFYYSLYGKSGKAILINNEEYVVSAHIARGINPVIDETPLKLLINLAKNIDVLFDIGANIGIISVILSKKMQPGTTIYSFEPAPNTFKFLADTARVQKGNAKVLPYKYAISNKIETLHFTDMERTTRNHITNEEGRGTVAVDAITIDSFCATNKVVPQLFKIDVEGAEYRALQGMAQTLKNNNCTVLVEIHPEFLQEHGVTDKMFEEYVNAIGYKVFNTEGKEIPSIEILRNIIVILAKEYPGAEIFKI
jgi:FkbM family methyltransferase